MAQDRTGTTGSAGPDGRAESPEERMDRNWSELLQELRVAQTGVQVLSGLLLTVPFQQRFILLSGLQRDVYVTAFVLAALSTGLLVAPVSSHRLLFRKHEKDALVGLSDVLAKLGLVSLALTVCLVVFLIISVVVSTAMAWVAASALAAFFLVFWVVLPLVVLQRAERQDGIGS